MKLQAKHAIDAKDFKHVLDRQGAVVIPGVRSDESGILQYARVLGSPELDIPVQLSGPTVMHLRFDDKKAQDTDRQAYFTSGAFPLHTDLSYVSNPPRYLLTMCVTADESGGGITTLASIESAWQQLSSAHRSVLMQRSFSFENAPNTGVGVCKNQPIHEANGGAGLWRFRLDTLIYPRDAAGAVQNLTRALERTVVEIPLECGDLLILDNHRVAHGRTAFNVPSSRHLLRAYAD